MIKSLKDFYTIKNNNVAKKIAIASACDDDIELAYEAVKYGIAQFVFIGDSKSILNKIESLNFPKEMYEVIPAESEIESANVMMKLINQGIADIPMKGLMQTGTFMKAILNPEQNLRIGQLISQITVFEGIDNNLQMLTDCAINIEPDLQTKVEIIKNAVGIAENIGYYNPKVALLGSVETVNPKMPDTIDSSAITQMNRRNQITNCTIDGPLALDNAISIEATNKKKIQSEVRAVFIRILFEPT